MYPSSTKPRPNLPLGLFATLSFVLSAPSHGEALTGRTALEDIKLYVTSPIRWDERDWIFFGGAVLATGVAHEYDDNVRAHFTHPNTVVDANAKDTHSSSDATPAAALVAGTIVYAAMLGDSAGYHEAASMLEAAGLSAATGLVLKQIAGRERPNETTNPDHWRESGDSFPSLHVTAAFAIGTVLAESGNDDYRWLRRILGYGVAGWTLHSRLEHNVHWLSDTVAGAAIGTATGHFVLNRRNGSTHRSSLMLLPTDGGVMLSWSAPLQ